MYQNVLRTDPYRWLGVLATPVTLIRAPAGMRGDTMDFSQSPTWTGLGPYLGAVRDEMWEANSHFIPMEDPARIAARLAEVIANPGYPHRFAPWVVVAWDGFGGAVNGRERCGVREGKCV